MCKARVVSADTQRQFDAIASPVRREILWLTWNDELTVGQIGSSLEISGPTLSAHLSVLRDAGLVSLRSEGTFRYYRADQERVSLIVPLLASNDDRWTSATDVAERRHASTQRTLLVEVHVDVPMSCEMAFAAFVSAERYEAWLGVPVSIEDGRFRLRMEWGTEVRGTYEVVAPPQLIAMRWDFDDDAVPLPGRALVAYLRVMPRGGGCRVEVHQHAADDRQAAYLTDAWSTILGRFADAHDRSGSAKPPARRPVRAKRT
jgi:DNA-binding transcriptional ArsR family regulator